MGASAKRRWTRTIKRATVRGGEGGNRRSRSGSVAVLLGRLRRLEVVVLNLTMKMRIPARELDKLLESMVYLSDVEEPKAGSGGPDARGALPVSHSGPADGQVEGEDDSER